MARPLEIETLRGASQHLASEWMRPDRRSPTGKLFWGGRSFVLQELRNYTYKDEFDFMLSDEGGIKGWLTGKALTDLEDAVRGLPPREDKTLIKLLAERQAIDLDGAHIPGKIGLVQIGSRFVGTKRKIVNSRFGEVAVRRNVSWPVYAGEPEEREAGNPNLDVLPDEADPFPVVEYHAVNPCLSAETTIAMLDALATSIDEGTTAATIRGRTGAQPADPDATETGTLLFTLTMADPAFNAAVDDTDGSCSMTADTITDDSSADATNTLGYCRVGATGTGADDHLDGSVGTSSADFIFNTLSIVSGAVISMSSFVIGLSQGSTAT